MVDEDIQKKAFESSTTLEHVTKGKESVAVGKLEFEALMRMLDSQVQNSMTTVQYSRYLRLLWGTLYYIGGPWTTKVRQL